MNQNYKDKLYSFLSLVVGFISFLYFCDFSILNPNNFLWLMDGDPAQHYLGWETFRSTPILQWPVGLNYNYGMETSNSIVFTDSIPIVAIILKIFSSLLPVNFQYTGIWLLACYILQSFFGYKVIYEITKNNIYSLIAGFVFSFASIFLQRTLGHFALCAHFLILASFYLYIKNANNSKWTMLVCLTSLVHAYLLVMVLAVYATRVAVNAFNEKKYINQFINFSITIALCLFVMYCAGYFVIKNGLTAGGYGLYRTDTLSIFNPVFDFFSRFAKVNNNQLNNGEGLGYIGFGMIISLSSLFIYSLDMINKKAINYKSASFIIPVISIVILYVFAVSNVISIQGYEIYRLRISEGLQHTLNTFRAGGRFIWPVAYIIMIGCIISTYKLSKNNAVAVMVLIAAIQFIDTSRFGSYFTGHIGRTAEIGMKTASQKYSVEYSKFKDIVMLPPSDFSDKSTIIYLAATHNLPVNAGYMARFDVKKSQKQSANIKEIIDTKELNSDSIYFIGTSASPLLSLCGNGFVCEHGLSGTMMYKSL